MDRTTIVANVGELADRFAEQRHERQRRRELHQEDFDGLAEAGFLLCGVPVVQGGAWEDVPRSARWVGELLRTLARGDSSVALVSAMHPAVLSYWLCTPQAPSPFEATWEKQRRAAFQSAREGAWWGTITSEPGTGGDPAKSRMLAERGAAEGEYLITGQKHFGSGSGIMSYMITTALPEGESEPDWFYLKMRDVPWDGSAGLTLTAPWDGHGMTATQSHALRFERFPATRFAWRGGLRPVVEAGRGLIPCLFTAVVVGIVETALAEARSRLAQRKGSLRPYEQVEWSRAEVEGWLIQQAYEGMVRALEDDRDSARSARLGKAAIAELAETVLRRLCRALGGGTFSRHSPFGFWYEDVRALGFLRPPWGLAHDEIHGDISAETA